MSNNNYNKNDVAARLKGTREYLDLSIEEMAEKTMTSLEKYKQFENGEKDFPLSFLNDCAEVLGIELIELLTGDTPRLTTYSLTRKNKGFPVDQHRNLREGFLYQHIAHFFRGKKVESFIVTAPYSDELQTTPILLSSHDGQEMDMVISGQLKIQIGHHTEILNEGDSVYFDATNPHGMIAINGNDCEFLAVLI